MKQPFTKAELITYIGEQGWLADVESMWLYYEKTEFYYVQGRLRIPLKNWKSDVNLKLRNGKFNARRKPVPRPHEPEEKIIPATAEEKAEFYNQFQQLLKKPTISEMERKEAGQRKIQTSQTLKELQKG